MNEQFDLTKLPILPYGTSGHAVSQASEDRAKREDSNGTTGKRQRQALESLQLVKFIGVTWRDLSEHYGLHHGQASSVLSGLHKRGLIVRLTQLREKCSIYVLPEFVNGRETSERKQRECKFCGMKQ